MKTSEKLRSDLERALEKLGAPGTPIAAVRSFPREQLGFLPEEALAILSESFGSRWLADRAAATRWLGTVAGIFLRDYDGSPLSREDWIEVREAADVAATEFDLDLLSYVMGLVLEHGAL